MKQTLSIKKMLLSMAVLLTVGTISMSLISCGDDDDNASLYNAWEFTNLNQSLASDFSEVVWDFSTETMVVCYGKRLSDGQWSIYFSGYMTVNEKNATSGTFVLNEKDFIYSIKGNSMTIKESDGTVWKLKLRKNFVMG